MGGTRALVTGGGGFIGSHLSERLLRDGYVVRVFDNFSTGRRENLADIAGDIDLVEGDIRSSEQVHAAVRGCELVFHQAALPSVPRSIKDPVTSTMVNAVGTLNVLLACRGEAVRRVVFASSSSIYGANAELPKREDMAPQPIAPYAVSKLAAEGYCRSFHQVYGLETIVLRYFNNFGERQDPHSEYSAVIPRFIVGILEDRAPVIYGDGEISRDFCHVDNTVEANLLGAMAPASLAGRVFNIASGESLSLNGLIEQLRQITEADIVPTHRAVRPGDVPHSLADISTARLELGYEPGTSVSEGLRRAFAHYSALAGVAG